MVVVLRVVCGFLVCGWLFGFGIGAVVGLGCAVVGFLGWLLVCCCCCCIVCALIAICCVVVACGYCLF